jgi:S1-C subfamily serine protease
LCGHKYFRGDVAMTRNRVALFLVLLTVALVTPAAWSQPTTEQKTFDAQQIYDRVLPSIAIVHVTGPRGRGTGTGFVVDAAGTMITAAHVAQSAQSIEVEFGDRRLPARLIGYDARRDIAMLQATDSALPALEVADSSTVREHDRVVVIGAPRGRAGVMYSGTVRALRQTFPGRVPEIMIAFEAIVQPGNSGGPLFNDRGQVIGVVVAGGRQEGASMGLAVASSVLREQMSALSSGARMDRAWIGLSGTDLPAEVARQRGLNAPKGVLVLSVIDNGPAKSAGVRSENGDGIGDIIVALDGRSVNEWDDLLFALGAKSPGDRVVLTVLRGGARMDITVVLGARND